MTHWNERREIAFVVIILVGLVIGPGMTENRTDPAPPARAALRASFASAIRNLVYRWDPQDPRPEDERRRALFEFIYQTYESSAWIPQSLFDSNLVTQVVAGDVETIVRDKAGLTPWRDNAIVPAFGMAPNAGGDDLKWTVNCLTCHTAEIDGITYFGAGTKTFDDKWLGESLRSLTAPQWRGLLARNRAEVSLAAEAHRILSSHHHDKIDSLTRGRSTAFAASHVELYMRPHNGAMPAVDEVGRGDVKTPPLWHTAAKIPSGRWYSDGSFHGAIPLMASSMELEKGSIATWRKEARRSSIRSRSAARSAMASTTAGGTSTGRARTTMSGRIDRGSTWCRRALSTPSMPARSRRRVRS